VVVPYLVSRSPDAFYRLLSDERVTVLNQTPAAFRQLIQAEERLGAEAPSLSLRYVVFGGEALEPATLVPWFRKHGDTRPRLVNMYGITETTVHVTYRPMDAAEAERTQQSPIGVAIPDLQLYVLDARLEPVPIGVAGEIFVGGAGLARGYLGRPGLTAERFIPHPFSREPGARLYRTGDLARFTKDGQLEYLGRIDHQVKIRGFRIELGEIQTVLSLHPAVREALVLVRENSPGNKSLVAYVASPGQPAPSVDDLRQHLLAKLPDYMVPGAFVMLERFPLTANGKVDRKALPEPETARADLAESYVAPRTQVEEALCAIWAQVLDVPRVGIHDNFFALGGDSILSIQVLTLAQKQDIRFSLQQLFQHQTVAALAAAAGEATPPREVFPRTEPFSLISAEDRAKLPEGIEDAYPLARIQAGMLFHMELAPTSNIYHNTDSFHLRLKAPFDAARFEEAVQVVVARQPVLRTAFDMTSYSEPLQLVHREARLSFEVTDVRHLPAEAQDAMVRQLLEDEKQRHFDLACPPLLRFFVHIRGERDFQFTLTECHAIIDGWSLHSTLVEMFNHYYALVNHQEPPRFEPLGITYRDFVAMERQALASEPHQRYWRELLADGQVMRVPRWRRPLAEGEPRIATVKVPIPPALTEGLNALTRSAGVPLKSILLASHLKVMSVLSGQEDVITGTGVNSRPEEGDGSKLRGIFLNTVPFRLKLAPGSWLSLVRAAFEAERSLYPFRRYPMADIQRQWGREALYEVMFNYMHFHVLHDIAGTLAELEALSTVRSEGTNVTLAVHFQTEPHTQEITLELDYNAVELEHAQVEQIGACFARVLHALAFEPDAPHHTSSPLPVEVQHRMLVEWNATAAAPPTAQTFQALFEARAAAMPDAIAVVDGERTLTYRELDESANRIAHNLLSLGAGLERVVALCMDRSLELVTGLLAALKAGAAYLPLDPSYPAERLAYMLSDSRAVVLITTQAHEATVASSNVPRLLLGQAPSRLETLPSQAPVSTATEDSLAYVIYTSGSTGLPKGTLLTQRGLLNYLTWAQDAYAVKPGQGALVHTSIAFDATITSLLTPLLAGGTVHLLPPGREVEALAQALAQALQQLGGHDLVKLTPAHLQVLSGLLSPESLTHLTGTFVVGGEALPPTTVAFWRERAPQVRLVNEYGPTETVVGCATYDVSAGELPDGIVPIGRPIANTALYILDARMQPVPVGVTGELYIGGTGVARGYLGRPDLTAERFVADPFSQLPGQRLYRTGDHARFLPDGNLEFLGRRDGQVKLRGYRIELGEVESTLRQYTSVSDAVVIVREDVPGDHRLAAYVVPAAGAPLDTASLRAFLQQRLPEHMVPSALMALDVLPLTPNGKVDRKALPVPDGLLTSETRAAPRNGTEELLASIWADVLRTSHASIHDHFFDLGGHSLLATRVVSRIREAFGVELPIAALFEAPTIATLAERVQALQAQQAGEAPPPPLRAFPRDGELPLSFAQQRLWFMYQMEPDSPFYNMPAVIRLTGVLNPDTARRCLEALIHRHESLRTTFRMDGQTPVQVIHPPSAPKVDLVDLRDVPPERREAEARRLSDEEARRPFDLTQGPLCRMGLIRLADDEHLLLLTLHHIIADGWSLSVLVREVAELYAALSAGQPSPLSALPVQYADYARWQREWLSGPVLERQLDYWKQRLEGAPPHLDLPTDRPRPPVQSFRGATQQGLLLPAEEAKALQTLCRRESVTPFMAVMAAFQALLHRYTGETDVVVGTDIANRNRSGTEGLIGFFVNQLVMRGDLSGDPTFRALLARTRRVALDAYAHQDLPFEELVKALNPERDLSYSPLFQVKLILQNAPSSDLHLDGLTLREETSTTGAAKFDMTWVATETERGLECLCEYSTDLFDAATVDRMLGNLRELLLGAMERPDAPVSRLPLLSASEREQALVAWNDTATPRAAGTCAHHLFEQQVARTPDAVAVSFEDQQLTYRELDARANQLAWHLKASGVGPEVRVGLCVDRSLELVVGILGILKAGGAWLPLDPSYPVERLTLMMRDAAIPVLVTQEHLADELPALGLPVCLDADWPLISSQPQTPPTVEVSEDNLAYIIFTSGSTGRPKGTLLTHRGLCNTALAAIRAHRVHEASRVLQFAALGFDASVCEVFSTLLAGARLCLAPRDAIMPGAPLQGLLTAQEITGVTLTPSVLAQLESESLPRLETVVSAGEACPPELARRWLKTCHFINAYGPTETTICASVDEDVDPERLGIGRAWANVRLYVLDANQQPLPVGVPGELFIGGVGVARGYLGRPDLTAERFVPDPFSEAGGERLYRTGDRVRWLPEGRLEFLGRLDHQVKLRGFRIELGEVEAALAAHPEVRDAAVLVREEAPGRKQLVAYVVADDEEQPPEPDALRKALESRLPDYMVPSAFVMLKAMPLTPSGKVDRAALPALAQQQVKREHVHVAPRTPVEQTLADIWAKVLSRERVSIHDNFFELGGDSIVSIQVIARALEAGLHISPRQFFQYQTIALLAPHVGQAQVVQSEQGPVTGPVPLTPIQHWFFEWRLPELHHYNQALLLGLRQPVAATALQDALRALVAHHDALRLRFERTADGWRQEGLGLDRTVALHEVDLSALDESAQRTALEDAALRAQSSFRLEDAPLVAAVLFHLGPQRGDRLLFAVHHLAVDAVSWRVLLTDLETACQQRMQGQPVTLPPKTTSFQAWARRLEAHAASQELEREADHWLRDGEHAAPLPVDMPDGENTLASARTLTVALEPEETRLLLQEVPAAWRARIDEVLLTALAQTLSTWTGQRRLRVQLEGHGREDLFEGVDLSRTVGWFTSTYPVTLELPRDGSVGGELRAVRDALRQVPHKGMGYGLLRYLRQDERGARLREQPEAPVAFNYLGQLDSALPAASLLTPADEPFGAQQGTQGSRRQVLEVNAHVLGGKLEVSFTYSETLHQRTTIGALAQGYLHALRALVEQRRGADAARFSPADFPLARVTQATLDGLMRSHPGMEDLYPLSPMQQGMLFHALLDPASGMYFERAAWTLDTDLDREALREAWQQVMARYPILRTGFVGEELEAPLQLVNRTAVLPWEEQDWSHLAGAEQQARLSAWMDADRAKGFDLKRAPLMRVGVLRLGAKTWRVVWSFHHLLLDGWSVGRVLNEVLALYDAKVREQPLHLEPPPVFRDYIAWLDGRGIAQAESWWKQALHGFGEPTPLPGEMGGQARGATQVMGERKVHLSAEVTEQLRAFSRRHQVTLSTLVQAAWALVLGRHAGMEDVVFGVTVAGRPPELPGVEQMVGLFINTLPARVQLPARHKVVDWLKELQAWQVERAPYEYAPLVKVQGWSPVPRGTPLFESLVVFENYPVEDSVRQGAGVLEVRDVTAQERTNYPLTLSAHADKQLMLNLDFESPRLGVEAMEQLLEQLQTVLVGILDAEDKHLWELSLLTPGARHQVLYGWNDTHVPGLGACLHELFEAQARRTPDAIAVVAPEAGSLTYGQLDARANQLAHHLRARGIGPEVLVGVCLERTPELLVALLGILKAGGAYVPLDPTYPAERLARMASEARLSLLLTQQALVETFANPEVALYLLDTEDPARAALPTHAPPRLTTPDGLAYVVFTSGSTGMPKGVMVSHRSWANAYLGWERSYGLREHCQSHLQMASFSFDVFAGDLSRALCSGGKLVLCPREWLLEPPRLLALMREERVDCAEFVPAVLRGLLQHLEETGQKLDFMRVLVAGSDAWYVNEYHRLQAIIGDGTRLINSYGVSEATIDSTWFESGELGPGDTQLVPIGRPFANNQLYVLDAHQQPVPAGIAGELFIGGEGVARGYCHRPELTAERFVPAPFSTEPGARLYRTGDRARYLPGGDLEFLGRADTQVKLRGFRVELGEIEAALGKHPSVQGAAVLLREDPGTPRRLVAYVVGPDLSDMAVLRDHLRERLPDYMVPAVFVRLDAIPLSPNGKVDRKAFPAPDAAQRTGEQQLVEPRSETEASLLALWRDVLGQTSLGVTDDFFDVGGHSLLATQIISRANTMFDVKLPLRVLFEHPTIAGLAEQVVLAQLEGVDEAALASAMEEVGGLSDADLEELLEGTNE